MFKTFVVLIHIVMIFSMCKLGAEVKLHTILVGFIIAFSPELSDV